MTEVSITRRSIEAAIVGSMVLFEGRDAAEFAAGELTGAEFWSDDFQIQFNVICEMLAAGIPCDAITLGNELSKRGKLEAAGGVAGIAEVLDVVPHSAHIRFYVQQLQTIHQRDELRLLSERLKRRAEDPTSEPDETINATLNELETLRAGNVRKSDLITAGAALLAIVGNLVARRRATDLGARRDPRRPHAPVGCLQHGFPGLELGVGNRAAGTAATLVDALGRNRRCEQQHGRHGAGCNGDNLRHRIDPLGLLTHASTMVGAGR